MNHYILGGDGEPAVVSLAEWSIWFRDADRTLRRTNIGNRVVSTVFLGIDHRVGSGPPVLWETAIKTDDGWEVVARYESRAAAIEGHERHLVRLLNSFGDFA